MLRALTVGVAIVLCAGFVVMAQADVAGNWTLTLETPQGNNDSPMTLQQDGATLTGTVGTADAGAPLEGSVDGDDVTFSYEIDAPQVGAMTLTFSGMVEGSSMNGTVDFGGFMQGSFTAVKN